MDLLDPAPFAFLGKGRCVWFSSWLEGQLRLCCNEILRCRPGSLIVIALCCNSFSFMRPPYMCNSQSLAMPHTLTCYPLRSRWTSGRDLLRPEGRECHDFVSAGNCLAARCVLMIFLANFAGCRWLLEQPKGSCLGDLRRFQLLFAATQARVKPCACYTRVSLSNASCLGQVFRTTIFMGAFGGETQKPHYLWSNDKIFLDKVYKRAGTLSAAERSGFVEKLVDTYIDGTGKKE